MNERMEEKSKLHEEESNGKGGIFVREQPCRNQLECPEEYSLVMEKTKHTWIYSYKQAGKLLKINLLSPSICSLHPLVTLSYINIHLFK